MKSPIKCWTKAGYIRKPGTKKGATLRDWFQKEDWRQVNNPKKKCGEK